MSIRKRFFSGVMRYWKRLPWKLLHSPSVEVFKNGVDVELRVIARGCGAGGLTVRLDDLRGLNH